MATIVNFALSFSHSSSMFRHDEPLSSPRNFSRERSRVSANSSLQIKTNDPVCLRVSENYSTPDMKKKYKNDNERIKRIHSLEEFDEHLLFSEEKLVIAHFSTGHYKYNSRIRHFMEEQCIVSNEVKFLYILANENKKTEQLCKREKIDEIPHFIFYRKTAKKINQASGFQPRKLADDILFYGYDPFSPVVEVKSRDDLENLIKVRKLVVVNVVKDWCSPCAKIYPGVIKVASQMTNKVVFARINVDENDGFMGMMREMDVRRVPAFLFFENGNFCGRYVGSNMSVLIRRL
ncbi:CDSP32 protein [Striga asiatica]|uniref:CDSP32 protein n=1 Tax=Striga asiatica TaxID=4170 RepID=A0A5A7QXZ3_STRAF|nr:CDSP32 protein [Striga asiatica]